MTDSLDNYGYRHFCGPQKLHRQMASLYGVIQGIGLDGEVSRRESEELRQWCEGNAAGRHLSPFREIISLIEEALEDDEIVADEWEDIRWFVEKVLREQQFYGPDTEQIQVLHGVLHGILADDRVDDAEIASLADWLDVNSHLAGCYPFDEIVSLLTQVLRDGRVSEEERGMLHHFFAQFVSGATPSKNKPTGGSVKRREAYSMAGVCAVDPEIVLEGRTFCFTGVSGKMKRSEFRDLVKNRGGIFSPNLVKGVDYLIYGDVGNDCWAFACYGRKVERAMQMRKEGAVLVVVHENDFWDAVAV